MSRIVTRLTIAGRPFDVYGSPDWQAPTHHSERTFIVMTRRLPQDPTHDHGGYNEAGFDPYPWGFIGPIQAVPGLYGCQEGWGIVPPYPKGYYVVNSDALGGAEGMQAGVLGFATTAEEAGQAAAESLTETINARVKAA